jgi:hypothetical protein
VAALHQPTGVFCSALPQFTSAAAIVIPACVCLLLQYLLQSCSRGGREIVEDICFERRRAEACVD